MATINRTTMQVLAAAGKANAHSRAVHELVGSLDSAVAPTLRGDLPEYGTISALWTDARSGMKTTATHLGQTQAKATAYAELADLVEEKFKKKLKGAAKKYEKAMKKRAKESAERAAKKAEALKKARGEAKKRTGINKARKRRGSKATSGGKKRVKDARRGEKIAAAEAKAAAKDAAKWGKRAKHASRGNAGLGAAIDVYDQYKDDSRKHPHMSKKAKAARAGIVAGGALGGAYAGGQAGAVIGSVVPGPGTAVGAVVGAGIGAAVGSGAAKKVIDSDAAKAAGHAAEKVGEGAKKGAKAAGHAAEKVGGGAKKGAKKAVKLISKVPTPW